SAVAFLDTPDDAGLRAVADRRICVALHINVARIARFDDCGAAIAEQRHQHPALLAVWILDLAPVGIDLDDPDRQVAALVEPGAGIVATGASAHHRLAAGD